MDPWRVYTDMLAASATPMGSTVQISPPHTTRAAQTRLFLGAGRPGAMASPIWGAVDSRSHARVRACVRACVRARSDLSRQPAAPGLGHKCVANPCKLSLRRGQTPQLPMSRCCQVSLVGCVHNYARARPVTAGAAGSSYVATAACTYIVRCAPRAQARVLPEASELRRSRLLCPTRSYSQPRLGDGRGQTMCIIIMFTSLRAAVRIFTGMAQLHDNYRVPAGHPAGKATTNVPRKHEIYAVHLKVICLNVRCMRLHIHATIDCNRLPIIKVV